MRIMDYTRTDLIEDYLRRVLTKKRYQHSLGVAKMAKKIAKAYGADPVKAYYAGLVHDIAKCLSAEEMNRMIRMCGLSESYWNDPALAHSKVGVCILRDEFGVDDPDILMAVSSHTTGRYGMTLSEEILYVADAIEENRKYDDADRLRKLALRDLHRCCKEVILFCLENLEKRNKPIDADSLGALKYIEELLAGRNVPDGNNRK